jgi:methylenetetrahydrofolate dehydrogenase (NADP+)/methenyltetrahydrofolate cyclohydrolase
MTGTVIDGKASAARLRDKIAAYTADLKAKHNLQPGLATVLVGKDPASEVYVRNKRKTAEAIGFKSVHVELPADVAQEELLKQVKALCADKTVHGILVQLPLPGHLDEAAVLDALDPAKDVDALTPTNAGLLLSGRAHLVSCTPAGVMLLLNEYAGDIAGKEALVIGRSLLFGKPAAQLLLAANCTVTMAHSRSRDLPALARRAEQQPVLCLLPRSGQPPGRSQRPPGRPARRPECAADARSQPGGGPQISGPWPAPVAG